MLLEVQNFKEYNIVCVHFMFQVLVYVHVTNRSLLFHQYSYTAEKQMINTSFNLRWTEKAVDIDGTVNGMFLSVKTIVFSS